MSNQENSITIKLNGNNAAVVTNEDDAEQVSGLDWGQSFSKTTPRQKERRTTEVVQLGPGVFKSLGTRMISVDPPDLQNDLAHKIKDQSKSMLPVTNRVERGPGNSITTTIRTQKQISEGPQFRITEEKSESNQMLPLYANKDLPDSNSVMKVQINPNSSIRKSIRMPQETSKVMSLSSQGPFLQNRKMMSQPVGQMNASAQNFVSTTPPEGLQKQNVTTYSTKRQPMAANPVAQGVEPLESRIQIEVNKPEEPRENTTDFVQKSISPGASRQPSVRPGSANSIKEVPKSIVVCN